MTGRILAGTSPRNCNYLTMARTTGSLISQLSDVSGLAMNILVIEDDAETAEFLSESLREAGHAVTVAFDGADGLVQAMKRGHDVLIVDRMLPSLDGLTLVKTLRGAGVNVPTLFLTAVSNLEDRVAGLNAGADDYLSKPFALSELLARVDAVARRPVATKEQTAIRVGALEIDVLRQSAMRDGKKIALKPLELRLLNFLMKHAGAVVTRTMLLESVWDFHFNPHTNIVETHISRLRAKIDKGFATEMIETVRGAGYRLNA